MASIINVFRKEEPRRSPLHARWGDVGITAPTEGSWSQFDNPHKARRERTGYGPGFVPDCNDDDDCSLIDPPSSKKSATKRHQFSIPKSSPLSRIRSITKRKDQKMNENSEQHKTRFSYKPIVPNYMENLSVGSHDAQETYFEELAVLHYGPRSTGLQATMQHTSRHFRPRAPWDVVEDDDDRSISTRSSSPVSQTQTLPYRQRPQREASDKKKKYRKSLAPKPVTMSMVADRKTYTDNGI